MGRAEMVENEIDIRMDLEWVFNDATGDLGLSSNHGTVVALIEAGAGGTVCSSAGAEAKVERTLESSARYRRIHAILDTLSLATRRGLRHAFTRRAWPAALGARPVHQRYAACSSPAAHEFLTALGAGRFSVSAALEWLVKAETPTKDLGVPIAALAELRLRAWEQAEAELLRILVAYAAAARAWREAEEAASHARLERHKASIGQRNAIRGAA